MLGEAKPIILVPTIKKDEAKEFYGSVLGLSFKYDDGFALVFETAGIMLRITPVHQFTPHQFSALGWQVDNINKYVKELAAKGVKFETYEFPWMEQDKQGIWTAPDGTRVAWFKDPDGNLLSVAQHAK